MRNSVVLGMLSLEKTLDSTWHLRCCIFPIFHKLLSLRIVTICQSGHMMYIFYGSLGVLLWKCGTQLLKVTIFPHKWQWFNYKDVSEKAEGWNIVKYILTRWLLHKVHQWVTNQQQHDLSLHFFPKEAKYRSLDEEEEKKKKLQLSKMSKYKKVVY